MVSLEPQLPDLIPVFFNFTRQPETRNNNQIISTVAVIMALIGSK